VRRREEKEDHPERGKWKNQKEKTKGKNGKILESTQEKGNLLKPLPERRTKKGKKL